MVMIPDLFADHGAETLRTSVRVLADAGGMLSIDELAEQMGHDSYTTEWDDVFDELLDYERIVVLIPDHVGDAVSLLADTTLTHRLTAEEIDAGWVCGDVDFDPLQAVAGDSIPLLLGGRLRVTARTDDLGRPSSRLIGPPGWLSGARPGDLLGLRLSDAVLHVEVASQPDADAGAAAAVAAATERTLEQRGEIEESPRVALSEVLYEALARDGDALRGTLPPLGELAAMAGVRLIGEFVAPMDADEPDDPRRSGMTMSRLLYGLDDAEAEALQDLREARAAARTGPLDTAMVQRATAALAMSSVAYAFGRETGADDAAERAAERAAASAAGASLAGARYVLALAGERRGDAKSAETLLNDAIAADGEFAPALRDAAWYAEDRGDAARALTLLRRAGAGDSESVSRLLELTAPSTRGVGRNERCPCGSGRKYKVCCGARAGGPLAQRAEWLIEKVVAFALRPPQVAAFEPFIAARRVPTDRPGWQTDAITDPLVLDCGVFDGGVLQRFLDQRGFLLPLDERALADSWLKTRRSVYRVERQRGDVLEVSDAYSDERLTVRSQDAPPVGRGTYLLGRVLPCSDALPLWFWAPWSVGPMALPREWLDLEPEQLAAALPLGQRILTTTERDPLVLVTQVLSLPDDAAARRVFEALMEAGLQRVDETTLHEVVKVNGGQPVRGFVHLEGDAIRIETNAEVRADRLARLVADADPSARSVVDRRAVPWQFTEDQDLYGVVPAPHEPTAEERDAVAALVREQEERWLDEAIPALGGLTPRQAVADDAMRAELEKLLDMPTAADGFNGQRLRSLLGLQS